MQKTLTTDVKKTDIEIISLRIYPEKLDILPSPLPCTICNPIYLCYINPGYKQTSFFCKNCANA